MNSVNNLSITGVMTGFRNAPERKYAQFTLIHNIGGDSQPLFLKCNAPKRLLETSLPRDGDIIRIEAYLRPYKKGIIFNVKSFNIR